MTKSRRDHPHYLGDYEAIVLEPDWHSMMGVDSLPEPGYQGEIDERILRGIIATLELRAAELEAFLKGGGILIAKILPEASVYSTNRYSGHEIARATSLNWLISKVPPLWLVASSGHSPFVPGSGREIVIRELDHPFEAALGMEPVIRL